MDKILYLECESGISGDMSVAALLDLGASEQVLRDVLSTVPLEGFEIKITKVKKASIECLDFDVVLDSELDNHDHDMEYLYGHLHDHDHHHDHSHEHSHDDHEHSHHHDHEHSHDHEHHNHNHEHIHAEGSGAHHHDHTHAHVHRGLADVYEIIDATSMTDGARKLAKEIFLNLGKAEAKAHGHDLEQVHFHEVGAVDSIVDIISIAVCMDNLGFDKVCVKALAEGQGTVRCAHGILSVPVPAVLNIVSEHKIPLKFVNVEGELVTPTGASFVATVRNMDKLPDSFVIEKVGLGAGKRDYKLPGILRAMIISPM